LIGRKGGGGRGSLFSGDHQELRSKRYNIFEGKERKEEGRGERGNYLHEE